jgi:eukaryotic-like serine/threonine-protein kinase
MPLHRSKDNEQILGYRLIELLGAGGFGEVWKAEAPGGLLKAIKFIYGELTDRQAGQELKALEQIKQVRHPFVLSLERVEILDGQLIMVSELADNTLLDRFEESRAGGGNGIPREELLRYLLDAAEALDFITMRFRLQHLDVKPSNLFLMGDRLKVGDFGLVREVCLHFGTSTGGLTPAYASPETFTGEVSSYSDQYGLAIVYQEMLTGTRPFRGRTVHQLSEQHLHAPPNLASLCSGDQSVIGRALSKNPNDRFPTCGEMVRALLSVEASDSPALEPSESNEFEPEPFSPSAPFQPVLRSLDLRDAVLDSPDAPTLRICVSAEPAAGARSRSSGITSQTLPEGFPAPTLFVGIGGIAGSVLCQIKHLFESRGETLGGNRHLQWLLLDTDRATLQEARRPNLAGRLVVDETLLMPLHGPEHYRPQLKELLGWLARHWVYRIPRSRCPEGIRPLGRLALIDNAERVRDRLRQAIKQMDTSAQDEERRNQFQVIVIASISGGTGGGCFADLGLSIRQILREERMERASVEGVMILASGVRKEQRELAQANAYVTLSELRYYLDPNCRIPAVEALGLDAAEAGLSLFDQVYLAEFGEIISEEDIEPGSHLLAEHVYLRRGTPCERTHATHRRESEGAGDGLQLRSFRLARLGFPRAELRELVVREACRRIISRWLHGISRPADLGELLGAKRIEEPAAMRPPSPVPDADNFFAQIELDEKRFQEVFLERMEQARGSNPLISLQRQARDLLQVRGKARAGRALVRFFDELDSRLGAGSIKIQRDNPSSALEQKLHNAFTHDKHEIDRRLEAWVKHIIEDPAQRLKPARDGLNNLIATLVEQLEATPAQVAAVRERRDEIRERYLGKGSASAGGNRRAFSHLLRAVPREVSPREEELCEYSQLLIKETALHVRAEMLSSLHAKALQVREGLNRLQQGLEHVERSFAPKNPRFRNSQCATLGSSADLLPVQTASVAELRETFAGSFCSDRRLAYLERRFHEEVLEPHGGLTVVMTRESGFVTEVFQETLFRRVAGEVHDWLGDSDAASILYQRSGSIEGVVRELIRAGKSILHGHASNAAGRLILGLPSSPSGRSLRESLAKSASELSITDFVSIPDDVVFCLEIENLSFYSVLAKLVSGQPWLTDLAPKLVSREDVDWPELTCTAEMGKLVEGGDDL